MSDTVYCYPETDVLINKLNIHNSERLRDAERDITSRRLLQLYQRPIKGNFDYAHLKKIHRFIFQDIYAWAGKERIVDIAKSRLFCKALRETDSFNGQNDYHLMVMICNYSVPLGEKTEGRRPLSVQRTLDQCGPKQSGDFRVMGD